MMIENSRKPLEKEVAIVTGGARGIGQAICLALAKAGASIIVGDIIFPEGTVDKIRKEGGQVIGAILDVLSKKDIEDLVSIAINTFGKIDILVNNAGICERTHLLEISEEEWDRVIAVNLKGAFFCTQAVFPIMQKQKYGKIVFIGSIAGKVGGVISGPHYVASKGGIHAFAKWVAKAGAPYNIRANVVAPGPVRTKMTEGFPYYDEMSILGRLGKPEDIAAAVVYLVSPGADWVTGIVLDVNGGMLMD